MPHSWRVVMTTGLTLEPPYPHRLGQIALCPAATSRATAYQLAWVRGWPCSSTTGGSEPPCRIRKVWPPRTLMWSRAT